MGERISPLELKSLDRESLNSLLMSDNLMLREEVVWNVIKEVTLTDPKDDTLSDLIGCVRFGLLDKKCWKKEVFPSTQFKRYIELNFPDAFGFESPVLMVLGGYDGSGLTETTEILDETNMKWVFGSNMMDAKSATASCTVSFKDIEPEMFQKFRDFCAP